MILKNKQGMTLVEALVAISVFSVLSMVVSSIFLNVNSLQRNTANFQRLQNDGRFIIEKLAREIRSREITYPVLEYNEDLIFKKDENNEILLVCYDSVGKDLKYYITQNPNDVSADCIINGSNLNSDDIVVSNLSFYVWPVTEDAWGVEPTTNLQPRVTILLKIENDPTKINERNKQELVLQTTISSKVYKR